MSLVRIQKTISISVEGSGKTYEGNRGNARTYMTSAISKVLVSAELTKNRRNVEANE